jgi:Na+-translocating ferredoxin:NAD+ oxidoreductase RnfD subunit
LEYIRTVLYQGWEMEVLFHKFSSGTLLLFTFFMITDPMTIPNSKKARIIWSIILATVTFICSAWMQLYTAPIWVLFCMTPITIWLDKKIPEEKFKWITN